MRLALITTAVATLATAAAAHAADLVVTSVKDDVASPPVGSLRGALLAAGPGDRIMLPKGFIALRGALTVTQPGLRIVGVKGSVIGPVKRDFAAALEVDANGVTVEGVEFLAVRVLVKPSRTGFSAYACSFEGDYDELSAISFEGGNSGSVVGSEAQPNTFDATCSSAISASDTDGLHVVWNRFGKKVKRALHHELGESCEFAENTGFTADVVMNVGSATIRHNRVRAIDATAGSSETSVTIIDNTVRSTGRDSGVSVTGFGVVAVTNNTVTCAPNSAGIEWESVESDARSVAAVSITNNTVIGGSVGISAASGEAGSITISGGSVTGSAFAGVTVKLSGSATATVSGVTCNRVGRKATADAFRASTEGANVLFENCTAADTRGSGFAARLGAGVVTFRACTATGSSAHGFLVAAGCKVAVQGGDSSENKGAGIYADGGSHLAMDSTVFGKNRGPAIDLSPLKATPNEDVKAANDDLDYPDAAYDATGRITGTTVAGGTVVVYAPGPAGKLAQSFAVVADGTGHFEIPAASVPAADVRLLVRTPDDQDVSEMTPVLQKPKPGDGGSGTPVGPGGTTGAPKLPAGPFTAGQEIVVSFELQNPNAFAIGPFPLGLYQGKKLLAENPAQSIVAATENGSWELLAVVRVTLVKGNNVISCKYGGKLVAQTTIVVP